ncbi:MAG: hypothetical protein KatS3mg085_269 [Candidatus Dojkabacteria bacterium]|nr:MAG: hypothetical protein KatS3mg085_269 [Candidatus Dojkabacteria bacterium]
MKDLQYTLGLDIGSATIGWAVIEIQKENEYYRPVRLIDTGVRVFEAGVNAGDKHPNQVRREARSSRRVVRRRKYRIKKLKKALDSFGFPTEFDNFDIKKHDPWFLRCKALDERLTDEELARVLIHIVKRRGFKSNRKNIALEGEEGGKLAENISKNQELLKNYRTVGEMFYKDEEFKFQKRNRRGNYKRLVTRKMLEDELKEI